MARAVQFDRYGGREVLYVATVEKPVPGDGEVLVAVRAAGVNPGEAAIREGAFDPDGTGRFPSGQGTDFAGVIAGVGRGVSDWSVGDEVIGWSEKRSSQAEYVVVPREQLVRKPAEVSWEVGGALFVVAATAYAAVRAVNATKGDTVVVSAAAGGVGSVVVQLLVDRGCTVIGIASEANHEWLQAKGVTPVAYGDGLADRVTAMGQPDAFIDCFGPDYVHLAVELGVKPERIDTIIAFEAADEVGAKAEGSQAASSAEVLTEMAALVADGKIEIPLAASYPLDSVQEAYGELEKRHTRGKIVLLP